MALEHECDLILKALMQTAESTVYVDPDLKLLLADELDNPTLEVALSKLAEDGNILPGFPIISAQRFSQLRLAITPKGREFIHRTSYVQEAKRARKNFISAIVQTWLPHAVAIASLIVAILSWHDARNAQEQVIKLKIEMREMRLDR